MYYQCSNKNIFSTINIANPYRTHFSGRKYSLQEKSKPVMLYRRTPLIRTPLGPWNVSWLWGCPHFVGALISWVSFKRGSTLMPFKEQIVSVLISNHENKKISVGKCGSQDGTWNEQCTANLVTIVTIALAFTASSCTVLRDSDAATSQSIVQLR